MTWAVKTIHRGDLANPVAESLALTWRLRKTLNEPGEATIILNDDSSAAWQKYNVVGANSYLGGRVKIEYPAATTVFDGCITRIEQQAEQGTVTLTASNWLQQLTRQEITFDTRADLNGAGLRESHAAADFLDKKAPVYNFIPVAEEYHYLADRTMSWAADVWNPASPEYYVVFPHKMAATQSIKTPAYDETVSAVLTTDTPVNGEEETWETEGSDGHQMVDGADWTVDYQFAHELTLESAFYVASSYTGSRVHVVYKLYNEDDNCACTVSFYDEVDEVWRELGELSRTDTAGSDKRYASFEIPKEYSSPTRLIDAGNPYCRVRFSVTWGAGAAETTFAVYYLDFEVDVTMTPDNGAYNILDTSTHYVQVDTDLTVGGGKGIWEGCPYSIAPVITHHLTKVVGDYDTDVVLDYATNVTASTEVVARNFFRTTPLEILQALAKADGTDFWLDATLKLTWNSTYPVAGCTNWTDASVLHWLTPSLTVHDIKNSINITGLATNYSQVSEAATDAASIGNYGTYSLFVGNPAIYADHDAEALATALKNRYGTPPVRVAAEVNGFPKTEVGIVLELDSTKLELTDAYYVITDLEFDQSRGTTIYHLAPRADYLHPERIFSDTLRYIHRDVADLTQNVAYTARPREVYT